MTPRHPWFECCPAKLRELNVDPSTVDDVLLASLDRLWPGMNDAMRHRTHKFACDGNRDERTLAVISWVKEQPEQV